MQHFCKFATIKDITTLTLPQGEYSEDELIWFRKIYDQHYDGIRNFTYFKTGDVSLADDIVQDTFIKLWSFRKKVRHHTIKSLLYTIASNLIKNVHKHQKVAYRFGQQISINEEGERADEFILTNEFKASLEQALASIPEKSRVVFLMSRMEELTYNEIAERLNLSVKAIEKRMSEAIKILRSKIDFKL